MKAGVANPTENFPEGKGETRDLVAKATGFGNGKTYEQAKKVVQEAAPELVAAMDSGEASVSAAAALLAVPKAVQAQVAQEGKSTSRTGAQAAVGAATGLLCGFAGAAAGCWCVRPGCGSRRVQAVPVGAEGNRGGLSS